MLAICTVLFGPIGTVLTFLLLPSDGSGGGAPNGAPGAARPPGASSHMRVLHLSLAHSDVKARFVIDERSDWDGFLQGCAERLKIPGVAMVTDATGEGIHSIADLVHEDNIIVHAGEAGAAAPRSTAAHCVLYVSASHVPTHSSAIAATGSPLFST